MGGFSGSILLCSQYSLSCAIYYIPPPADEWVRWVSYIMFTMFIESLYLHYIILHIHVNSLGMSVTLCSLCLLYLSNTIILSRSVHSVCYIVFIMFAVTTLCNTFHTGEWVHGVCYIVFIMFAVTTLCSLCLLWQHCVHYVCCDNTVFIMFAVTTQCSLCLLWQHCVHYVCCDNTVFIMFAVTTQCNTFHTGEWVHGVCYIVFIMFAVTTLCNTFHTGEWVHGVWAEGGQCDWSDGKLPVQKGIRTEDQKGDKTSPTTGFLYILSF